MGLSGLLVIDEDDRERRTYGRGGGLIGSVGEVIGDIGVSTVSGS